MRLSFIFMFLVLVQVSATSYSQSINLEVNNMEIRQVIKNIEKQSEYRFFYTDGLIDLSRKVDLKLTDQPIDKVLSALFDNTHLGYQLVNNKLIMLAPKEVLQQISITGTVTDSDGQPLPGVSVLIKGTVQGTATDAKGVYTMQVPNENVILVFSYIGFINQELVVGNKRTIDISMIDDIQQMDEVVVVGYGTQKKVNLTGAVDAISGTKLQNRSTANVADLIKGASPNLNITMGRFGGEPGATSSWNIRGVGSINANAAPLILIDGIEVNINNIDPESIESVSVLKDASASAIYGSRAPFGVVLITTKRGKQGKVRIEYNNNLSMNMNRKQYSFENSLITALASNQACDNAGIAHTYSDGQIERIKGFMDGSYPYEYDPKDPPTSIWQGRAKGNANYDWPQILLADHSFNQKHNINVSGGNEKTNYYFSAGFYDQDGIYRYGYDDYKRYNLLSNHNSQVTDWMNVRTSIKYANGLTDYPVGMTTVTREYLMGDILMFSPLTPKYNINGSIAHPLLRWQQDSGRDKTETNDFFAGLGVDLEPVKGWVTSFSYNYNLVNSNRFANPKPVMVELGTGSFGNVGKPDSGWEATYNHTNYSLINVVSSYETNFGGHYLKALVGYEQEERKFSSLVGTGVGLITNEVTSLKTALGTKTVSDEMNHWATQGVFGRFNYNYKEKYLFEFSARYNGSSRFSPDNRWGFFPSASVAYAISKENFWSPIQHIVNSFKMRGSYGSLGNQNVGLYAYLETMGVQPELSWIIDGTRPQYITPPGLISHDLTWETITTLNLGLDAAFLNNRLQVTFDWFDRVTTNMMGPTETLPYQLGVSAPNRNNAEMSNKGFELMLSWIDRLSNDFSYNVKIGLGDNKAKILKYYNDKELISGWYPGKVHGEIWGYTTDGIMQTQKEVDEMPNQSRFFATWSPGDIKYKDLNNDGKIDDGNGTIKEHGDLRVIGNTTARYNISISAGIDWKGFDFNMFWQGVGKRDYFPVTGLYQYWGIMQNYNGSAILKHTEHLNYWRPADETNMFGPNTDAFFAKPYFSAQTNKNRQVQTKHLVSLAYLRLKNIQIGYTLPSHISQKIFMQRARIFISGEDLLTIDNLPRTMDPETTIASDSNFGGYDGQGRIYPLPRVLSLGVNLTF